MTAGVALGRSWSGTSQDSSEGGFLTPASIQVEVGCPTRICEGPSYLASELSGCDLQEHVFSLGASRVEVTFFTNLLTVLGMGLSTTANGNMFEFLHYAVTHMKALQTMVRICSRSAVPYPPRGFTSHGAIAFPYGRVRVSSEVASGELGCVRPIEDD